MTKSEAEFLNVLKSKVEEERVSDILYTIQYEQELLKLQAELVNLQQWVDKT